MGNNKLGGAMTKVLIMLKNLSLGMIGIVLMAIASLHINISSEALITLFISVSVYVSVKSNLEIIKMEDKK